MELTREYPNWRYDLYYFYIYVIYGFYCHVFPLRLILKSPEIVACTLNDLRLGMDVRIKPLKAWHDVTDLEFIIYLMIFQVHFYLS